MARQRPTKRNLVRWTDDLDKGVMLSMQYACAEAGIKIPWGRVAEIMGPVFTEGAIVQHLAKLRGLMAKSGIPVPPALKRGMVTKEPSKVYTNANNKHALDPITPLHPGNPNVKDEDEDVDEPAAEPAAKVKKEKKEKAKPKARGKAKVRGMIEDDEEEPLPELYDSDEDFGIPKKKTRRVPRKAKQEPQTPETVLATGAAIVKVEEPEVTGPATRTRGVKRDYSCMTALDDEEETFEEQDQPTADFDDTQDLNVIDTENNVGEVDVDVDADADDEIVGEDHEMLHEEEEDSDASTRILQTSFTPRSSQVVADTSYGQITMGSLEDPLHLYGITDEAFAEMLTNANQGMLDPQGGASTIAPHDVMNNSFHGSMGMGMDMGGLGANGFDCMNPGYFGTHVRPANMQMLNGIPQGYAPSLASGQSPFTPSRPISASTGMLPPPSRLPTVSANELRYNGLVGDSPSSVQHLRPQDIITEQDMMDSMPSDDILFSPGDFLHDDI